MQYISTYTRKEALCDGALVDVTQLAKEAGFKWPVAITQKLHAILNNIPEKHGHQDYTGRLWDVLSTASFYARSKTNGGSKLDYKIVCHHDVHLEDGEVATREMLELSLTAHPGDEYEPVITIGTRHCD